MVFVSDNEIEDSQNDEFPLDASADSADASDAGNAGFETVSGDILITDAEETVAEFSDVEEEIVLSYGSEQTSVIYSSDSSAVLFSDGGDQSDGSAEETQAIIVVSCNGCVSSGSVSVNSAGDIDFYCSLLVMVGCVAGAILGSLLWWRVRA